MTGTCGTVCRRTGFPLNRAATAASRVTWEATCHPTPLTIIGDAAVSEWLAGPRRVLRFFQSIPLTCVLLPPEPGGPLWQVNQLLVERIQRGFSRHRSQETVNGVACHPDGPSLRNSARLGTVAAFAVWPLSPIPNRATRAGLRDSAMPPSVARSVRSTGQDSGWGHR